MRKEAGAAEKLNCVQENFFSLGSGKETLRYLYFSPTLSLGAYVTAYPPAALHQII